MKKGKVNQIVQELKNHYIFNNYWNDDILTALDTDIEMRYESTEYNGYYKAEKIFLLNYMGCIDELKDSTARFELVFTSTTNIFDLEKAQEVVNAQGEIHAINAFVKIYNSKNEMIYTCEFTLWNKKPEKISGYSDTIKFFKENN